MADVQELLDRLWRDYVHLNPHALRVCELLGDRGERIRNDHVAFRTWGHPHVGLEALARPWLELGYQPGADYDFPAKKLEARHYEHADPQQPKVFISQLKLDGFSPPFRTIVQGLIQQVPDDLPARWDFPVSGRPWEISWQDYQTLRRESDYAAWLAALGWRANHFTVDVGALKTFDSLEQLNGFLEDHGFALNSEGGQIKGSPAVYLEQSSTLAEEVEVEFSDGVHRVPGCYYEFARRYPLPDGKLFTGFVAKSADKIFQSTDPRDGNEETRMRKPE